MRVPTWLTTCPKTRQVKAMPDGNQMILLHGFIKKSNKTPQNELNTATTRLGNYWRSKS
jgi:phage-related protein